MRRLLCPRAGSLLGLSVVLMLTVLGRNGRPAAAQTLPASPPPPTSPPAPAAGSASTPGYHIHIQKPSRVGDVETDQVSAQSVMHMVLGPAGAPMKTMGERQEIQAVYRSRVAQVDAKGHATKLRVLVQSASGRATGEAAMKALTTAHASLLVVLFPTVKITRSDGRPIPAREVELWGLIFDSVDPKAPTDDSGQHIPTTLHVGDSFVRTLPDVPAKDKFKPDPNARATTVVTGSQEIEGATYLILKTHLNTALDLTDANEQDFRVTSGKMDVNAEQTAPTDPARPLAHSKLDMVLDMTGQAGDPKEMVVPVTLSLTRFQEMTVRDFQRGA